MRLVFFLLTTMYVGPVLSRPRNVPVSNIILSVYSHFLLEIYNLCMDGNRINLFLCHVSMIRRTLSEKKNILAVGNRIVVAK